MFILGLIVFLCVDVFSFHIYLTRANFNCIGRFFRNCDWRVMKVLYVVQAGLGLGLGRKGT